MSRRTRIKMGGRGKEKFTLTHHSDYASTTTYFPRAYSMIGKQITFPISILPIVSEDKVNYAGSSKDVLFKLDEAGVKVENVKLASISLQGQLNRQSSTFINMFTIVYSMLFFCFSWLLKTSCYRRRFFPTYVFNDYDTVVKLVRKFKRIDTLIINFQDNNLNLQKMELLDKQFADSDIKTIVFRNLTYYIQLQKIDSYFPLTRAKKNLQFKFIWEKFNLLSNYVKNEEEDRLLHFIEGN